MVKATLTGLAWTLFITVTAAGEWTGPVVAIADGDTLSVLRDNRPVKIRLWGVDCPESRQDFGTAARKFLGQHAHGKTVTVHERGRDRYGRVVTLVEVDGVNLNRALVEAGLAWVYRHYCREPERSAWDAAEADAREQRIGLWTHPHPTPPWEWRRDRRTANSPRSPAISATLAPPPALADEQGIDRMVVAANTPADTPPAPFRGNIRSRIIHVPTCSTYTAKNCVAEFPDPKLAHDAGYRPCMKCFPVSTQMMRSDPSKAA